MNFFNFFKTLNVMQFKKKSSIKTSSLLQQTASAYFPLIKMQTESPTFRSGQKLTQTLETSG